MSYPTGFSVTPNPLEANDGTILSNPSLRTGSSADDVCTANPPSVLRTRSWATPSSALTSASRASTSLRSSGVTAHPSGYLISMQVSLTRRTGRSMEDRYRTTSALRMPASRNGVRIWFSGPAAMPGRSSPRSSTISPLITLGIPTDSAAALTCLYIEVLQM